MNTLKNGRNYLIKNNMNLVVIQDDLVVFESNKMGIIPMFDFYNSEIEGDVYIIDKFIGSGAARLLLKSKANIKGIFTFVISKDALKLIESKEINVEYERIVTKILNKRKDDLCPIEKISLGNDEFSDFYSNLEKFIAKMK
ncbi:DUF1893 domain-containing protein [Lagierella sp.]|uniref:DUF1893 domain-containing protein n=1 Tax=Lagierella sp. TaxID=2849657 RepID=UPI002632E691|nr:DUF1893 domain-containing protein [Lagierella sp.]